MFLRQLQPEMLKPACLFFLTWFYCYTLLMQKAAETSSLTNGMFINQNGCDGLWQCAVMLCDMGETHFKLQVEPIVAANVSCQPQTLFWLWSLPLDTAQRTIFMFVAALICYVFGQCTSRYFRIVGVMLLSWHIQIISCF